MSKIRTRSSIPPSSSEPEQLSQEQIDKRVEAYRQRLIDQQKAPKPSAEEQAAARAERLIDQLGRTQVMLGKVDQRRINLLIRAAALFAKRGDYSDVFGVCAEVLSMCRTEVLGYQSSHPIAPVLESSFPPRPHTIHPPSSPPSFRAGVKDEDEDED